VLRDPTSAVRLPVNHALSPAEEALAKEIAAIDLQIVEAHAHTIRGRAAASMGLALLMLYAAAAALSRDRRGRTITLIAAWAGIVYHLGSLPVVLPIARDYAAACGPLLEKEVRAQQAAAAAAEASAGAAGAGAAAAVTPPADAPKPEAVDAFIRTVFVVAPIALALLGVSGSVLLIVFFGGRRGRALYGLDAPARGP
jgi:hypothetical protein